MLICLKMTDFEIIELIFFIKLIKNIFNILKFYKKNFGIYN